MGQTPSSPSNSKPSSSYIATVHNNLYYSKDDENWENDQLIRERYQAYLTSDKPVYQPGESVYIRAVILHAFLHCPLSISAKSKIEMGTQSTDR